MDIEPLARDLAEAARHLADGHNVPLTAQSAVDLATGMIDGCDLAGLTLVTHREVRTVAESDSRAGAADQWQHEFSQGPALEALAVDLLECPELSRDSRWPSWSARVRTELGLASLLSYRLFTHRDTLGTLTLYATRTNAFEQDDQREGHILAAQAAVALAAADHSDNLTTAVRHRTTIGQAQGILMERFGLNADQAFSVLVRLSKNRNQKLFALADTLVRTRHLPTDPTRDTPGQPGRFDVPPIESERLS